MTATAPDVVAFASQEEAAAFERGFAMARVTREPRTYEFENRHVSFFADLVRAEHGNQESQARLDRYRVELDVERRTNPNTTATTGGELTVPQWAIDRFTTQARAGRVLADLATKLPLPTGVSSMHMPKLTTSGDVAILPANADPVLTVDEVTADAGANGNIVTISGGVDASLQLLDQVPAPGYDGIVYVELTRAYNAALEKQCLSGTGLNGQLTGVQNVTSRVTDVSGAGVSASQATGVPQLYPLLGQIAAGVSNNRFLPPEVYLVSPRRWFWIASAVDLQGRPIATVGPYAQGSDFPAVPQGARDAALALGAGMPFTINGIPCYLDGAIPSGSSADVAIAARVSDMLLYESDPKFTIDPNPLSGRLGIRFGYHRYVAFVNTKPSSICVLTNLPAPTGF